MIILAIFRITLFSSMFIIIPFKELLYTIIPHCFLFIFVGVLSILPLPVSIPVALTSIVGTIIYIISYLLIILLIIFL